MTYNRVMKIRDFLKEKGQTSIEYMLMIAMSASMSIVAFKKFNAYILDNPDSYIRSHLKIYERLFDPQLNYKKFRLPR